jgi:hypothetical protein
VTTDSELKRSRGGRLDDARPARRNDVRGKTPETPALHRNMQTEE